MEGIFTGMIGIQVALIIALVVGIRVGIIKKGVDSYLCLMASVIIILSCMVMILSYEGAVF